jgi:adenylyltransferase/sulfurtransferase
MRFRELKLRKNPECPICGEHRTITKLIDYHQFCGVPQQATQETPKQEAQVTESEIEVTEVKEKLDRGDNFVLIDVREPHEYQICNIPAPSGSLAKSASTWTNSSGRYRDPLQERYAQRAPAAS